MNDSFAASDPLRSFKFLHRNSNEVEASKSESSLLAYLGGGDENGGGGGDDGGGGVTVARGKSKRASPPTLSSLDTSYQSYTHTLSSSSSDASKLFSPLTSSDLPWSPSGSTSHTSPSNSSGNAAEQNKSFGDLASNLRAHLQNQQSPPKRRKRRGELADFSSRFAYPRAPSIDGITIQGGEKQASLSTLSKGGGIITAMSQKSLANGDRPASGTSTDGISPSSSTTSGAASAARRQLMPSIPTRRGSSKNENGTSSNGTPAMGNQTNIQSLAQAIAARAQHIAAVKAAAAAHQSEAGSLQISPSASTTDVGGGAPRSLPAGPLTAVLNRKGKGISVAETVDSDYGDEGSDPGDHLYSTDEPFGTIDSANVGSRDRQDRDAVAQSFRWSQGDWADYAAALSQEINVGDANVVRDSTQPQGVFIAPPSIATINVTRKSVQYAPSDLANLADNQSSVVTGLGIATYNDGDRTVTTDSLKSGPTKSDLQSPLFAQMNKSTASGPNADSNVLAVDPSALTPDEQVGTDAASSTSHASTSHSVSRKTRPTPLTLVSAQSPTNSVIMSPSTARSLASPSLGGRTPPPTMPPSEPLPPLPSESSSSSALRRILSGVSADGSPVSSGKGSNQRYSSGGEQTGRDWKRSSDPSDHRSQGHLPSSSSSGAGLEAAFPRKMSLPYNSLSTSSLAAQSAALVQANRATTIAEARNAKAILGEMERQLTYDEMQERSQQATSYGDTPPVDNKPQRRGSKASTKKKDPHAVVRRKSAGLSKTSKDEEERMQDDDAEAADVAEAVVTRVTTKAKGARASVSRAPSIVRSGSSGGVQIVAAPGSVGSAPTENGIVTGEQQHPDGVKSTESPARRGPMRPAAASADRYAQYSVSPGERSQGRAPESMSSPLTAALFQPTTTAPVLLESDNSFSSKSAGRPSLNMTNQPKQVSISSASIVSQSGADNTLSSGRSPSGASLHGQTGDWTPTVDTPSALDGYGNPNESSESNNAGMNSSSMSQQRSFSALHNRRSEMDEDSQGRASASPIERIKRTEGRFAGAFGEIALAFKQLQAEKRTLEKVVRATTPLDGVGQDGNTLSAYLTSMNGKVEASAQEIRKLLDLMEQQRSVMDYMGDTHRLEIEALTDELEELKDDFDAVCDEADIHRGNAIQLTEELDKAQRDAITARAETLRYKTVLRKEEERKDQTIRLLQTARADLARLESERDQARAALRGREGVAPQTENISNPLFVGLPKAMHSNNERVEKGDVPFDNTSSHEVSLSPSLHSSSLLDRISTLEAELREARLSNEQLQSQINQPGRSSVDEVARSNTAASLHLSESDEAEREREALREKLFQQEQDIAELRAQIALGAAGMSGGGGTPSIDGVREGLPAAREDQIRLLMTQMGEQRTREAQIRKAYRQVRDELRKMQAAQQHDRRRISFLAGGQPLSASSANASVHSATSAALNSASSGASSHINGADSVDLNSPMIGGVSEDNGLGLRTDGSATGVQSITPRNLKRLSLPLVNKMAPPALNSAGLVHPTSTTAEERLSVLRRDVVHPSDKASVGVFGGAAGRSRPQSMMLHSGGTAPIFSSSANRRGSRTFSVDFSAAATSRRLPNASDTASADVSPRFQTHQKLFGTEMSETAEKAHSSSQREEEEDMERLQTPRQTIVRD